MTDRTRAIALGFIATAAIAWWPVAGAASGPARRPAGNEAVVKASMPAGMLTAPLYFEPNLGQAAPGAQFVTRAPGVSVEFREGAVQLALARADAPASRVTLAWANGRADARAIAEDRLAGTVNYLRGRDPRCHPADVRWNRVGDGGPGDGRFAPARRWAADPAARACRVPEAAGA